MNSSKDEIGTCKQQCDEMELTGPHFALQVALQTMKERCQRLQQRLSCLEEENSRLKLHKYDCEADNSGESGDTVELQLEQLKEQVSLLTRQKSQLSHQIIMVVTENKKLWNRLSHMTKINKSLGGHLSKISDTLNQHTSGPISNSPNNTKGDLKQVSHKSDSSSIASKNMNNETSASRRSGSEQNSPRPIDGSLEEISLKLLNSIQLEKSELEQQYAQMVEINNDTSPSFNLNTMGLSFVYEDEDHAVKLIQENCKGLEKMKQVLLDQQSTLKSAYSKVTALKEAQRKSCCHQSLPKHGKWKENGDRANDNTSKMTDGELKFKDQWAEDVTTDKIDTPHSVGQKETSNTAATKEKMQICPMCGLKWSYSTPFDVFHKHVTDHFPPDNDGISSLGNDFDIV